MGMRQHFFEIPLSDSEVELFDLPTIATEESRATHANAEPSLLRDGRPFYETESALYRWQYGWGMVLPRGSICSHLEEQKGACRIYPDRPSVCLKPQIFPYALERSPENDGLVDGTIVPAYVSRNKILAVWDCPYVRELKDDIARYAEMCSLEPVFVENKG